jgi:hypothetical protein
MDREVPQSCTTCKHRPGCLKRSLLIFLLFIQTGRDRELSYDKDGLATDLVCQDWKGQA